MFEEIKRRFLKDNDVVIISTKNESVEDINKRLKNISDKMGIHFYALIIPEGTEFKILNRIAKIKLKAMLEKSLKEEGWKL